MDNNDNDNRSKKFNNFLLSPFAIVKGMTSWQQQSATAWTETYKEFAAHSQKISESWSDALWKIWTSKEGLQRENASLRDHIDNNNNNNNNKANKNKKKMRVLVLQGGGQLEHFKLVLSKHYMKRLQEKTKKMEMMKDHYLTLLLGLQLVQ